MADCHDLFQNYLEKISLTEAKRENLRGIRNANRSHIKEYFREVVQKGTAPVLQSGFLYDAYRD